MKFYTREETDQEKQCVENQLKIITKEWALKIRFTVQKMKRSCKKYSALKSKEDKPAPAINVSHKIEQIYLRLRCFLHWLRDMAERVGVAKKKAAHELIWGYAIYSLFTLKKVTISYSACW